MNAFLCAIRLDGLPISKREVIGQLARFKGGREIESYEAGSFLAAAHCRQDALRPMLANYRTMYGAGDVRLDNRSEIEDLARVHDRHLSDLQVVLAAIDRQGQDIIPKLHGDFGFVAWDARAQKLIAARDAFGVKPVYYRRTYDHLLLSSRLEPLAGREEIDRDYVADFLIGLPGPSPRTVWQGTLQLEPGALLVQRGSVTCQQRYWSAAKFEPDATISEGEAVEQFRTLFCDAVQVRLHENETWSQLSGGLDSSAVVSAAEWMAEQRGARALAGSVTITDTLGNGDETAFSNAVTRRFGIRNEMISDYWPWRSDAGVVPMATDEPTPLFPFHARDGQMVNAVTHSGGRVLLSGLGADHYMFGTLSYMADMFARGSVRAGAREVLQWAMQSRRSVWHTARHHVLRPLLYNVKRTHALELPPWMAPEFGKSQRVLDRLADVRGPRARFGEIFHTHTATELARVSNWVLRGRFQDDLEMRYPFLSRKLVEFTLKLPVRMRIRPEGRKWILREAMRGIMPEEVRTRMHKGGMDARVLWALEHERPLLDALTREPLLADLGCIDPIELRRTVEHARNGNWRNTVHVLSVLALESWLRARTGTWPVIQTQTRAAA